MPLQIKSTDRVTISGQPGTGKTTLMKYLAEIQSPNVLVYDPLAQYTNLPDTLRYLPRNDSPEEFDLVCLQVRSRGNMMFLVEECERYISQRNKRMGDNAYDLVNRGRNYGIGIIANTRRIQEMDKAFFDLCQHALFFRCGLRSRDYVEGLIGKEAAKGVFSLDNFEFLAYDLEHDTYQVMRLRLPQRAINSDGPIGPGAKLEEGKIRTPKS